MHDAEAPLDLIVAEFYTDVDWAAILHRTERILALYSVCEVAAEDEAVYKQYLIQVLECLHARFGDLARSTVTCPRSHGKYNADWCKADLETIVTGLWSLSSELSLSLAGEGSSEEAALDANNPPWQLTSGEVEAYVKRVDGLLGRISDLRELLRWCVSPEVAVQRVT